MQEEIYRYDANRIFQSWTPQGWTPPSLHEPRILGGRSKAAKVA
jgi:hypothetical protein